MSDINFYVIENLKTGTFNFFRFDNPNDALKCFLEQPNNESAMPALGFEAGGGSLDLIQGVNGLNVLVPDYRRSQNFSPDIQNVLEDINNVVDMFVRDGVVNYEFYSVGLFDSARAIVPIHDNYVNTYCDDKTLKTAYHHGLDSVESVLVDGSGWVAFEELRAHPNDFGSNGVVRIDALNVAYVGNKNLVGIDGRMDISPSDFARMVKDISKEYALVVYDDLDYRFQFKDQHCFIVGSHDTLPAAVKGWYDIQSTHPHLSVYVSQIENGRESAVFNGLDDNFHEISYEEACQIYGFDDDRTVESIIRKATDTSKSAPENFTGSNRELDSRAYE